VLHFSAMNGHAEIAKTMLQCEKFTEGNAKDKVRHFGYDYSASGRMRVHVPILYCVSCQSLTVCLLCLRCPCSY
jgi:hypothetical protein